MGLIFTYLMTYGGSLVALFNPFVGLLIYVCFAIIRPESLWHWSVPQGNYSRIIAISLLTGWALHGFGDWRFGRAKPIVLCLLGFITWGCISATQALVPDKAWGWVESLGKVVIPFIVGLTLIDSVRKLKQLAWVILLSHGYVSWEFNLAYLGGFNLLRELGFGGMDNNCVAITLVTCSGLGFFLGLSAERLWQKGLAFGCLALMVHAVLLTFSRGGMIGLIIVAAVSFLMIPKQFRHYLMLIGVVAGTLTFTGKEVTARFDSTFASKDELDTSAQSRVELWNICLRVMGEQPLTGLGPAHFPVHAHEFGLTRGKEAHTTWLQLGAEVGVVGLAFLLLFYLICMARLWPLTKESAWVPDPWLKDMARMVIAALCGYMITAQFVSLVGLESPYYIVMIGAGALKLMSQVQMDWTGDSITADDTQLAAMPSHCGSSIPNSSLVLEHLSR